jgi:hypothetical protein
MSAEHFGSLLPQRGDAERVLEAKILQVLNDGGGGTGGIGNQTGLGSPVGVVTPQAVGQLYTDRSPPFGLWMATGTTSADWSALISA